MSACKNKCAKKKCGCQERPKDTTESINSIMFSLSSLYVTGFPAASILTPPLPVECLTGKCYKKEKYCCNTWLIPDQALAEIAITLEKIAEQGRIASQP